MHSLKHYKVLHEKNVILTIETAPTPRIDPAERVRFLDGIATPVPDGATITILPAVSGG